MEWFRILSVILQLMIGLYGLKAKESEDFCFIKLQFISIFNLGEHIIFQDKYKYIWKLNESDIMGSVENSFAMMERTVKKDHQMTEFLSDKFDLRATVFGFNAIEYDNKMECNSTDPEEEKECIEVTSNPNTHYTCFFGFNGSSESQKIDAFLYNYSALNEFDSKSLKDRVLDYCRNNSVDKIARITGTPSDDIQLIGGLQYFEYDSEHNYTRLKRQLLITPVINESFVKFYTFYDEYDDNNNQSVFKKDQNYTNTFPYTSLFYAFRYNKHLGVFGCPLDCDIRTNLTMFNIVKDEGNDRTIEDLIRCPVTKPWNPNEFCHQKGFISVFSLGKDIIFQNEGKIWRYISTGANNRGNPDLTANFQSIRFDFDLVLFLDYYFDTTRPIYGFTFKHDIQDMCSSSDVSRTNKCQDHFNSYSDLPYYRSCIYGESLLISGKDFITYNNTLAFMYNPSGLQVFSNSTLEKETLNFCKKVSSSLGSSFQMTSILGEIFINPDANTDIYALFNNLKTGGVQYFKTIVKPSATLTEELVWIELNSIALKNETPVHSINYLSFEGEIIGMTSQNQSDIPFYLSMSDPCTRFDSRTNKFEPLLQSIYSIYNCPFNQTYSESFLEEETLCTEFTGVFSLFQIGKVVYYQKGKRFYRALIDTNRRKFVFDKYFTDLMNDNFETQYKVLGYSYQINSHQYRAFIMGTTKHDTKSLGPKIFRAYTVGVSPLAPLEALNDASALYFSDITIGLNDVTLNYSRFNAMVYSDPNSTFVKKEDNKNDSLQWVLILILNETQLYYTKMKNGFEFPFQSNVFGELNGTFTLNDKYLADIPFTDIFGMFEHNKAIYASGWPSKTQNKDRMPRVFKIYDSSKINAMFLGVNQITSEPFESFFNCKGHQKQSDSTSDETNDALYFFIVLIVLLLLTGGVVGLIVLDNNKSNTKSSQISLKSLNSNKSQTNVSKSSEISDQKKSETKPLPNDKEIVPISRTGSQPSNDAKSGHSSIIQIRSDIGD